MRTADRPTVVRRSRATARNAPQVVLLAAGLGSRLGRTLPKPLTALVDGRSIMQQQLDGLRQVLGPSVHVTAVVGYRAKAVMRAFPDLVFCFNPDFAVTNTSQSLLRALRASAPGGVLWLNGDVVFEPAALEQTLPLLARDESFVCVDTASVADEEVKYTLGADGCIAELSKTVIGGLGEAVGINHVSAADKAALIEHLAACGAQDYFERGMEDAMQHAGLRFRPVDVSRFQAMEVDDAHDLDRANAALLATSTGLVDAAG